jgi:serine/threonine-protein kinase
MAQACGHCGQLHEAYLTMCPITGARLGSASYTVVNEDEILVGNIIAERYHVRDILGQGSTGTVFGALHVQFDRGAAMKVIRPRYTTLDAARRIFQTETRAALAISHPSLCEIFDIGTLPDGAPFFVSELLQGDTLGSRLGKERFSTAAGVDLMMQVLSAMEAVHAKDLLFRDLRPQNIFLAHRRGCRPVVKILDLGLSRLIPLEKVQAEWNALRGAVGASDVSGGLSIPFYLSPERTRGEHGIEPSSDIFIAAVIFYEALTGQKPFNGPSWNALLQQIAGSQPTPLSVLRPDVPEAVGALVMRAMSSKPKSRPASAREMQDELRSAFEAPRRGSASMRSVPVSPTGGVEPSSHGGPSTDRDRTGVVSPAAGAGGPGLGDTTKRASFGKLPLPLPLPPSVLGARNAPEHSEQTRPLEALYDDETGTGAKHVDLSIDEASADHPIRTVRPPPAADIDIDVDVDFPMDHDDAATSRGDELADLLGLSGKRRTDGEEETETMQLTPEVRARIEQMTKAAAEAASATEDTNRPPPTRRLKPS